MAKLHNGILEEESKEKSDETENSISKPLWLTGEVLLCQKFLVNNKYISTHDKTRKKKSKKKDRHRKSKHDADLNHLSKSKSTLNDLVLNDSKDIPSPGDGAKSFTELLNYFSDVLTELFPDNKMSDRLRKLVSKSDSIYIASKLLCVMSQLDEILENEIINFITENGNVDKKNYRSLLSKKKNLINKMVNLYIEKPNAVQEDNDYDMNSHMEPHTIRMYENVHSIVFFGNNKFDCKLCDETLSGNPLLHIISPGHTYNKTLKVSRVTSES